MQLAPSRQHLNLLSQPLFLTLKWPLANLFSISSTLSGSYLLGWVHLPTSWKYGDLEVMGELFVPFFLAFAA